MNIAPRSIGWPAPAVCALLSRRIRHPSTRRAISAAKYLADELSDDYTAFPILIDLAEYGVPQSRKRSFLTFIRNDESQLEYLFAKGFSPYPLPRHSPDFGGAPITLQKALGLFGLPSLDAATPCSAFSKVANGMHSVPVWSNDRYAMVAAIPPNSGGNAWQNRSCRTCGTVDVGPNAATCPRCAAPLLRPVFKAANGRYRLIHGFRTSTYARMRPDRPAATITTASGHVGSNNTIHPNENRLLSTLECALLQTIPRQFNWGDALERWGHTNLRDMIGEAVPPLFTRLHGTMLTAPLAGRRPRSLLPFSDLRCARAHERLGLPPLKAHK